MAHALGCMWFAALSSQSKRDVLMLKYEVSVELDLVSCE